MCAGVLSCVLFKPQIHIRRHTVDTYWMAALCGVILLLAFHLIDLQEWWNGVTADRAVNPIKILILFISVTFLSVFLDEAGFFRTLAQKTLTRAKGSAFRFFLLLYGIVSILTVFTSNDIIILTFTPFICYFCKNARIPATPFLITEFVAANTWSMALIIGNPTNIYLAGALNIDFFTYIRIMWLPTLFAGITSCILLCLVFRKQFRAKLPEITATSEPLDLPMAILGLIHLALCTVTLTISSFLGIEMWLITLCFALSLFICATLLRTIRRQDLHMLSASVKRAPWPLIPFVLSMFALVLALDKFGITRQLAVAFSHFDPTATYGITAFLTCNLLNNIPMSVLYSSILTANTTTAAALFASIIGSNIGALLSPIGALAGIMWSSILKQHQVRFSFFRFVQYGLLLSIPILLAALGGLALALHLFPM